MLWFTSDLHLHHENILGYTERHKFFADTDEMGRCLIENINSCVSPDDTLWILGDVCMGRGKDESCRKLLDMLVCKDVHLVLGNHDMKDKDLLLAAGFVEVCDYRKIGLGSKHAQACLMHYPMLTWDRRNSGSYMLHGHIHATPSYNEGNRENGLRRYDVGVDANGYMPVSAEQIMSFFDGMEIAQDAGGW